MVTAVKVQVNGLTKLTNYVNNLPIKTEKIGKRTAWNLTQFGAKALIQTAINAGIRPWRNRLLKYGTGIEPRKLGKGSYGIFIPYYGIHLDRMSPHFVSLKKGRLITQWARQKGINGKAIFVRPHPYVMMGFGKILNRLNVEVRKAGNKIVRG